MNDALRPLGGLAVVASMFLPWVDRGGGSTVPLRSLGDLLLAGDLGGRVPRWLGVVVYLIPLAGAIVIVADGLGPRGRGIGVAAFVVAVVLVVMGVVLPFVRDRRPGAGQWVAVAGVLAIGVSHLIERRRIDVVPGAEG